MVWPAVASLLGKGALSFGGWTAAKSALKGIGPKVRNFGSRISGWLGRNTGRAGAGAGGVIGGLGLSEIFDTLGIEDSRLQKLSIVAVVIGGVIAVGQLVNINLGGDN